MGLKIILGKIAVPALGGGSMALRFANPKPALHPEAVVVTADPA